MKIEPVARVTNACFRAIALMACCVLLTAGLSVVLAMPADGAAVPTAAQLFGVHPAQEGSTTLPGGHFNYALVPRQRISDGVVVENLSSRILTFHVYGADLITAVGGGLAPAQPTASMRSVGGWIAVSKPTVVIGAHKQVTDEFALTVPAVVSPGQHLGAVVVSADIGTTSNGLPIEARAALIAVVSIPGTAHASAMLSPLAGSTAVTGQTGFGITLSNIGNLLLTYKASVDVYDSNGLEVARLPLTPVDAYVVPGGHTPLSVVWRHPASLSGNYRAQATVGILVNGLAVATLHSQSLAMQLSPGLSAAVIVGIGLAVLLLLTLTLWVIRRQRRRRQLVRPVPAPSVRKRLA